MDNIVEFGHSDFKDVQTFRKFFKIDEAASSKNHPVAYPIDESIVEMFPYLSVNCDWDRILNQVDKDLFISIFPLVYKSNLFNLDYITKSMENNIKVNNNARVECMLRCLNKKNIKSIWLFLAVEYANLDAIYLLVKYKVNIQYDIQINKKTRNILQWASEWAIKNGPLGLDIYNYLKSKYVFEYAP